MSDLRLGILLRQAAADADGDSAAAEGLSEQAWSRARWRARRPRRVLAWALGVAVLAATAWLSGSLEPLSDRPTAADQAPAPTGRVAGRHGAVAPPATSLLVLATSTDAVPASRVEPAVPAEVSGRWWLPVGPEVSGQPMAPGRLAVDDGVVRVEGCGFTLVGRGDVATGRLRTEHDSWTTTTHPPADELGCGAAAEDAWAWHAALRGSSVAMTAGPDVLVLVPDLRASGLRAARLDLVRAGVADPRPGAIEPPVARDLEGAWSVDAGVGEPAGLVVSFTDGRLRVTGPCGVTTSARTWLVDSDGVGSSMLLAILDADPPAAPCDRGQEVADVMVRAVLASAPTLQRRGDRLVVRGWVPATTAAQPSLLR